MSRVLRRPMFRGGIADSEGVGITSGLDMPRKKYAEPNEDNNYSFVQQNDTYNPLAYTSETESQSDRLRRMREESAKKIRDYNENVKMERQQTTENFGINPKTGLPFTQRDRLNLQPSIIDIAKAQGVDLERGENNERLTARQQQDKTKLFDIILSLLTSKKRVNTSTKRGVIVYDFIPFVFIFKDVFKNHFYLFYLT